MSVCYGEKQIVLFRLAMHVMLLFRLSTGLSFIFDKITWAFRWRNVPRRHSTSVVCPVAAPLNVIIGFILSEDKLNFE